MKHGRPDYAEIQDPRSRIPEDEPVFLLRAQDVIAPQAVRYWAALSRAAGAEIELVALAEAQAAAMEAWPVRKVADLPPGAALGAYEPRITTGEERRLRQWLHRIDEATSSVTRAPLVEAINHAAFAALAGRPAPATAERIFAEAERIGGDPYALAREIFDHRARLMAEGGATPENEDRIGADLLRQRARDVAGASDRASLLSAISLLMGAIGSIDRAAARKQEDCL